MKISQLIALFVALLCFFAAEGFGGYKSRISHRRVSLDSTSQSDSNPAEVVEVKVIVSGKNVQGPWYRTTVRHETVFNRKCKGSLTEKDDSTTEIVIQGPKNRVDSFIRWVKRGPGLSQIVRVDNIEFQAELSPDILAQQIPFLEKLLTKR